MSDAYYPKHADIYSTPMEAAPYLPVDPRDERIGQLEDQLCVLKDANNELKRRILGGQMALQSGRLYTGDPDIAKALAELGGRVSK